MSDQLAGFAAAQGILVALVRRGENGPGQKLETSMLASTMAFLAKPIVDHVESGSVARPRVRGQRSQSYAFVAGDGLPLADHLSTPPKFWRGLATAVGVPELIADERFATKYAGVTNYEALHAISADRIRSLPRAEWLEVLDQHDDPVAPINTAADAIESPQARHIEMVWAHGDGDRAVRLIRLPLSYSAASTAAGGPTLLLSEHTNEVLERLGNSVTERAVHRSAGDIQSGLFRRSTAFI